MRELSIHEIGDRRNSIVVSTYRIDNRENPVFDSRLRMESPFYLFCISFFVFLSHL